MIIRKYLSISFSVLLIIALLYTTMSNPEQKVNYIFSHGIADSGEAQASRYMKDPAHPQRPYIIPQNTVTFDYPAASTTLCKVNRCEVSLAQDHEINHLAEYFYASLTPGSPVIMVGVSCGASCILNFMGRYQPKEVAALVLESPFANADNIVNHLLHQKGLAWVPGAKHAGHALLCNIFTKYKKEGIKPIQSVNRIGSTLPIMLICTLEDPLVPAWSTMLLYYALRSRGNPNVYILIIPHGAHAKLINHPTIGPLYQRVVHAFYKEYHFPHDPNIARAGKALLYECQPSLQELKPYIPSYALPLFNKWQ